MNTWNAFLVWFGTTPYGSWIRVFFSIILAQAVAEWTKLGTFSFGNWKAWAVAAVVALAPVIIRYLNPADTAYGIGKAKG
jgi:hypothetical protein